MTKDKQPDPRLARTGLIYSFIFLAMSSLILRMGYLQIVRGPTFRAQANIALFARLPVLPKRGWIYDKYMNLLAYDKPTFSVILTRLSQKTQDYQVLANRLAPVLHTSPKTLFDVMQNKDKDQAQVRIFENATESQIAYIAEHESCLPGIQYVADSERIYPYKDLAGHVLGYIQPQSADEVEMYSKMGYLQDQKVGITGAERQYETKLQGKVGYNVWEINNLGVPRKNLGLDPAPEPGASLQLTIDGPLQARAQQLVIEELDEIRAKQHYEATDAEAVLLDAKTGGVLAMVSYPYYDPNWFIHAYTYMQHESYITNADLTPILNHVLASPRYPGSTVKPVNIIAGLESGVISAHTSIWDPGKVMVGTYPAHDWKPDGHGQVDPVKAIQQSCDTFMYQLGMWLAHWHDGPPANKTVGEWHETDRVQGLNTLFHWEWEFGLGPQTGIDLPGEAAGRFYTDDSVHRTIVRYDLDRALKDIETKGRYHDNGLLYDNAFAAIGQMQEFTPLQLAEYAMTLANNGRKLQPHILQAVLSPDGKHVVSQVPVKVVKHIRVNPANMRIVQKGLYAALNWPNGTAYGSFYNAPYHAAGKTGTAEISQHGKRTDISLFMGYAPYESPEVCIAVMVPGGGESSDIAVPLARKLLDAYFQERHQFFAESECPKNHQIPAWWKTSKACVRPETS